VLYERLELGRARSGRFAAGRQQFVTIEIAPEECRHFERGPFARRTTLDPFAYDRMQRHRNGVRARAFGTAESVDGVSQQFFTVERVAVAAPRDVGQHDARHANVRAERAFEQPHRLIQIEARERERADGRLAQQSSERDEIRVPGQDLVIAVRDDEERALRLRAGDQQPERLHELATRPVKIFDDHDGRAPLEDPRKRREQLLELRLRRRSFA
jgi:hypothetical protein